MTLVRLELPRATWCSPSPPTSTRWRPSGAWPRWRWGGSRWATPSSPSSSSPYYIITNSSFIGHLLSMVFNDDPHTISVNCHDWYFSKQWRGVVIFCVWWGGRIVISESDDDHCKARPGASERAINEFDLTLIDHDEIGPQEIDHGEMKSDLKLATPCLHIVKLTEKSYLLSCLWSCSCGWSSQPLCFSSAATSSSGPNPPRRY